MVRPDGARTLAGYTLGARLGSDIYGEVYAGVGEGAREVQVLVVAAPLAGDRSFTEHLTRHAAPKLHTFAHRSVVGTVLVARDGRELVVVTEPVREARSVVDLLAAVRGAGGGLPPRVIAAVARAVIDGLASAHAAGLVHGAVHPRSVLIDRDGVVRLTDLAVGFAAMSAAAAGSETMPLRGLSGFVSPEVALGDPPTPAADVYGIGALMHAMITGDHPAGPLGTTPALERLILRALDTDLTRRFGSAVEMQENFAEALEDDRCTPATAAELAALWLDVTATLAGGGGGKRSDAVDAATEDLLASLDGVVEVSRPGGRSAPVAVAGRKLRTTNALDAVLFELDDEPAPLVQPITHPIADPVAGPSGHPSGGPGAGPTPGPDPAPSPIPGPSPDPRPTPPPKPPDPEPPTPDAIVVAPVVTAAIVSAPIAAAPVVTPSIAIAATAPDRDDDTTNIREAATVSLEPTAKPAARPTATPAPEVTPLAPPALERRSRGWLWLVIIAVGGAVLAFGLTRQKDELTAGEKAARDRKAAAKAQQDDLARRLRAAAADPGSLRVHSHPDNAGVWLLLGRAPFESLALKTDQAWELRVELEGHQPQDHRIGARDWQGTEQARRATLAVTLVPGAPKTPLPAIPPEPPGGVAGGVAGSGKLAVTSTPPGAAVWLLVGVTDTMELDGIEAGRDYDLKVTKDGFAPGFVRFAAEEWRDGGDPALPLSAAPKKSILERTVELVAAPRTPGKGR